MVRIISYKKRQKDEKDFFILEITGGIEMVKSTQTDQFYATAKKAHITSTFDEETCKALIGMEMPGSVQKIDCEPYQYTVQDTGEVIMLAHTYAYVPEEIVKPAEEKKFQADVNTFSKNGKSEYAEEFA